MPSISFFFSHLIQISLNCLFMAIRLKFSFLRLVALATVIIITASLVSHTSTVPHVEVAHKAADTPDSFMGGLRSLLNSKPKSELAQEEEEFQEALHDLEEQQGYTAVATNVKSQATSPTQAPGLHIAPGYEGYDATFEVAQGYQRQNATILTLCRNSDLQDMIETVRKMEDRFNRNYHYDWVFLNNEPFTPEFEKRVGALVSGNAKFGVIPEEHWSYPPFIDQEFAKTERERMHSDGVIYADSESYRHMCRFNSGFFFHHDLLQKYKYYWRVEPHVEFWCDVKKDPFRVMAEQGKTYGFTITIHEFERTIETLWETTLKFLEENPQYVHSNNLMDFISDDNGSKYNLCHFWSNFEIADMDFWRSPAYRDYFNFLDRTGGFFYERWGDAPIHSIAVALFEDKSKIHYFKEIGYTHGPYTMCPIEDTVYDSHNCMCEKKNDFTFEGYSCGKQYYAAMGLEKPANWEQYA